MNTTNKPILTSEVLLMSTKSTIICNLKLNIILY